MVWSERPAIRTQTKDARALDHSHPHPAASPASRKGPERLSIAPDATRVIAAGPAAYLTAPRHRSVSVRCGYAARSAATRHRRGHRRSVSDCDEVNRQVIALLEAGILRERRAELAVTGAICRPRVTVEVKHEPCLTLGIHIVARTTSIVATDLFGRTAGRRRRPRHRGVPRGPALASLADVRRAAT